MKLQNAGIYSVAAYLPPEVRTNDWWTAEHLAQWQSKVTAKLDRAATKTEAETQLEGSKVVLEMMSKYRADPFKGAKQRHVMPEGMLTSQMDVEAGRLAIERAGIRPDQIDVLLCYSNLPDYHMVANAATVHRELGLKRSCFSSQTDGVCNSFLQQLAYAEPMIKTGMARYALLIQDSGVSRFMRPEDPQSAWFGDGATALVVGPAQEGYGILGWAHETWSNLVEGIVCGVPGKRWWQGAPQAYIEKQEIAREMLTGLFHESRRLIHDSLGRAGKTADDVDFYACHQGFAWLREATQRHAGLTRAKYVDTFSFAGSMLGCNVPMVLSVAQQEGILRDGDLVAAYSGAAGAMTSALTLRWGGRC